MTEHQSSNRGADDCEIVEELLSGFYDEELNETADAFVRHHLDACEQCVAIAPGLLPEDCVHLLGGRDQDRDHLALG